MHSELGTRLGRDMKDEGKPNSKKGRKSGREAVTADSIELMGKAAWVGLPSIK